MGIVGAFIVPHGAIILNPKKAKKLKTERIHSAMLKVQEEIKRLKPNLIFITSPHGISLSNDFGIYLNEQATCNAEWENEYKNYQCTVNICQKTSEKLLDYLLDKETAVSGIAAYTPSVHIPLRWGEAVPLWFLKDQKCKYIMMSQPTKRFEFAEDMIPETLTLGNDLRLFFEKLKKRVVIIISADLSHTHQKEGPYGYHESAVIADDIIAKWANKLDEKILSSKILPHLKHAKICGYIGFLLFQGLMNKNKLEPEILAFDAPSYYGMMVAQYILNKDEK